MTQKIRIAVLFGGRSTEHEVSVISALQSMEHIDKNKYDILPIYISKLGEFYLNAKFSNLRNFKNLDELLLSSSKVFIVRKKDKVGFQTLGILPKFFTFDIAFPIFHGSFGEDGSIQGLFEMYQVPYVGFNVAGSAVAMDKVLSKYLFTGLYLPVGKYTFIKRSDWIKDPKLNIKKVKSELKFPMFIKPVTAGSSIGVNKAKDDDTLSFAIEVASTYSDKVLIEESFENVIEINCSALGYKDVKASVCEMPIPSEDVLTFADKYQRGGGKGSKGAGMASLSRKIPAPISKKLTTQIQEATVKIFKAFDGCGVARVDYFVDTKKEKFWVNELNSPPGSLSYYLWEPSGIKFNELIDILVESGMDRFNDNKKTQYVFESGLLSKMAESKIPSSPKN